MLKMAFRRNEVNEVRRNHHPIIQALLAQNFNGHDTQIWNYCQRPTVVSFHMKVSRVPVESSYKGSDGGHETDQNN